MSVGNFLKKIAPWIGNAAIAGATGNVPALVSMAAKAVSTALGSDVKPEVDAMELAVANATPDQVLALKKQDQEFAKVMQEMGFDHEEECLKIAATDRADARNREIKTGDVWTPRVLAGVIIVGWFLVQWFILTHIVPAEMRDIVMRTMGTLDMAVGLVLGYYYGSSASSAQKNEIIASQTKTEQ